MLSQIPLILKVCLSVWVALLFLGVENREDALRLVVTLGLMVTQAKAMNRSKAVPNTSSVLDIQPGVCYLSCDHFQSQFTNHFPIPLLTPCNLGKTQKQFDTCVLFKGQNQSEPRCAAPSALNHPRRSDRRGELQAPPGRPVWGKQALPGILDPAGIPQRAPEMLAIFLRKRIKFVDTHQFRILF